MAGRVTIQTWTRATRFPRRQPAHAVPTFCPQLQITLVNYCDGFPQFRYPAAVSTSLSKRLYTPAVGGSIPSAPTSVYAGQLDATIQSSMTDEPPLCQECAS